MAAWSSLVNDDVKPFWELLKRRAPGVIENVSIFCNGFADVSGCTPLKMFGHCLQIAANVMGKKDCNVGMPQQLVLIQEGGKKILDLLLHLVVREKLEKIESQAKLMQQQANYLNSWAKSFGKHVHDFKENNAVFKPSNLVEMFKHILENKCDDKLDALNNIYNYMVNGRALSFLVMVTFYANNEDIDIEERLHNIVMEFISFYEDVKNINVSLSDECWYFLPARDLNKEDAFNPVYIPTKAMDPMPNLKIDDKQKWQFWKTAKVEGRVFAADKGFMKFCPVTRKANKFGKELTAKFRRGFCHTYLAEGPAAMETLDNMDIVGYMNKSGAWIDGRLSRNRDTKLIEYGKYINGVKILNSTKYYLNNRWQTELATYENFAI